MATSTSQITWQAFEQLPDGDGFHREVVEGELIVLPPAKSRHARIIKAVARALAPLENSGPWSVFVEAGYRLSTDPPTWIQPDVSVLSSERAGATETARDLTRKVDLLLAGGSLTVWVIYPENREVRVFLPDGTSYTRRGDQMLTLPEPFPSLDLPVAKLVEN